MSINITKRTYKSGTQAWLVDIRIHYPCGARRRAKVTKPVTWSRTQTERWARQHEQHLIKRGPPGEEEKNQNTIKTATTFAEFAARFLVEYPRINNLRPSSVKRYEDHIALYFAPHFGDMSIEEIGKAEIRFLASLDRSPGYRNIMISEFACILRVAHDWGVRTAPPPKAKRVKQDVRDPEWYEPETYQSLIDNAPVGAHRVIVLLGGDAGLRCGEIMALRVSDLDFSGRGRLHVRRSMWKGIEGPTKGRKERIVPMTKRLRACLKCHIAGIEPHAFVLTGRETPMSRSAVKHRMRVVQSRMLGELPRTCDGRIHILRHTFCSNLVRAGKHPRVIQKLAGHASLQVTERYMSVAGDQIEEAIAGLDELDPGEGPYESRSESHEEKQ